jgi:hypothetical protein
MEEQKIKYKYKFSDVYNPVYVNGAHGGVSSQGEIILNFYLERQAIPRSQSYPIVEGRLGSEILSESEPTDFRNSFVRFIETGVVLNVKTAKDIRDFLDQQITLLESVSANVTDNN